MRAKIVAGNWKMNKTFSEGLDLIKETVTLVKESGDINAQMVFCTPFIHLVEANKILSGVKNLAIGAQNCYFEEKGAFTGEISVEMIKSTGTKYVILGHSERRTYFKEDDSMLAKKTALVLKHGLTPIFCCGEVLSERESNNHFSVVKSQVANALFSLTPEEFGKIVIAYEPVWAIGTGVTASSAQAQEMHAFIRNVIKEKYGNSVAEATSILYGGSCNASNAKELFANTDVDGGLIGGASLKASDFMAIYKSF